MKNTILAAEGAGQAFSISLRVILLTGYTCVQLFIGCLIAIHGPVCSLNEKLVTNHKVEIIGGNLIKALLM